MERPRLGDLAVEQGVGITNGCLEPLIDASDEPRPRAAALVPPITSGWPSTRSHLGDRIRVSRHVGHASADAVVGVVGGQERDARPARWEEQRNH